jgi:hypothetical protein
MSATPSAEKLLPHCDNWVGQSGSRFVWRSTIPSPAEAPLPPIPGEEDIDAPE